MAKSRNHHPPCQISRSGFGTAEKSTLSVGSGIKKASTAEKASRSTHGQISSPLRSGPSPLSFLAQIRVTKVPNPKRYDFNFLVFSFSIGASSGGAWECLWRVIPSSPLTYASLDPHCRVHAGETAESHRTIVISHLHGFRLPERT